MRHLVGFDLPCQTLHRVDDPAIRYSPAQINEARLVYFAKQFRWRDDLYAEKRGSVKNIVLVKRLIWVTENQIWNQNCRARQKLPQFRQCLAVTKLLIRSQPIP